MTYWILPIFLTLLTLPLLIGCPSKETGGRGQKTFSNLNKITRPQLINKELETALLKVSTADGPDKIDTTCPDQVRMMLPKTNTFHFTCGAKQVPEFHHFNNSRFIGLAYFYAHQNNDQKKPLLVVEQGGPGLSSVAMAARMLEKNPEILNDFDLFALDQRGTSWTRPNVVCKDLITKNLKVLDKKDGHVPIKKTLRDCYTKSSQNIDVKSLTSYQIAADIPFSIKSFGYDKMSFYGLSYGTVIGQYLLKYFSQFINKIVLDSPVVLGQIWGGNSVYKNFNYVFEKNLKEFVEQQKTEGKWTKNYAETLSFLKSKYIEFSKNPLMLNYYYKDQIYKFLFDENTFYDLIFDLTIQSYSKNELLVLLLASDSRFELPKKTKGDFNELVNSYVDVENDIASIMYSHIVCKEFRVVNERVSVKTDMSEIIKIIPKSKLGNFESEINKGKDLCIFNFPNDPVYNVIEEPFNSDKAVLVLGANSDHITPAKNVELVTAGFSKAETYIYEDLGHAVYFKKKCIANSILDYLKFDVTNFKNLCPNPAKF